MQNRSNKTIHVVQASKSFDKILQGHEGENSRYLIVATKLTQEMKSIYKRLLFTEKADVKY